MYCLHELVSACHCRSDFYSRVVSFVCCLHLEAVAFPGHVLCKCCPLAWRQKPTFGGGAGFRSPRRPMLATTASYRTYQSRKAFSDRFCGLPNEESGTA
mmetsp:Transcript_10329/g.23899  ORF Transcript_10329/g.23899 Transcript_10329/m.23899 type:complete len:99 (+) Transcript_10329:2090-2386(+)